MYRLLQNYTFKIGSLSKIMNICCKYIFFTGRSLSTSDRKVDTCFRTVHVHWFPISTVVLKQFSFSSVINISIPANSKLNDVSNNVIMMIIRLSVTLNKVNYQTTSINNNNNNNLWLVTTTTKAQRLVTTTPKAQIRLWIININSNKMLTSATKQEQWSMAGSVWVAGPGHI